MLSVINSNSGGVLKEMTKQDEQLYQYYQLYCFIIAAEKLTPYYEDADSLHDLILGGFIPLSTCRK